MFKTQKSQVRSRSTHFGALMLATGVIVGIAIGGIGGVIAAPKKSSKIVACANKTTGVMRYSTSAKCAKTETKVSWNLAGTSGTAGAKGETGTAGTNGTNGTAGAKGETGTAGTNGTNGTNATLAITQQSVCDGTDADTVANEVCKVGMTGPGGGLIFFVDYDNEYATYDYLEAAPTDGVFASSVATGVWATTTTKCGATAPQATNCQTATIYTETGVGLATIKGLHRGLFGGKAATAAIVARMETGTPTAKNTYAAGVADDYVANGITDWWLPSKDELQKMQENLNNKGVGGFAADGYWSSSEYYAGNAWFQDFGGGGQYFNSKGSTFCVRPVRAF